MTTANSVEISGPTMVIKETEACDRPHADEQKAMEITAKGKARRTLLPDEASVKISFKVTEPIKALVESRYREWVMKVSEIINEMAELSFSTPTFSQQVKEVKGKETYTTALQATGYIHIPIENFGKVLISLLEEEIDFETPNFSFDEGQPLEPDLYQEASFTAKQNAEALLNGVGCQLGELVGLTFFDSDDEKATHSLSDFSQKNWSDDSFSSVSYLKFQMFDDFRGAVKDKLRFRGKDHEGQDSEEITDWNPEVLGLLATKVPTRIQEIVVTVTYEVLA